MRFSILALFLISFFSGVPLIVTLFDPYSNFGRIGANIFRPIAVFFNNRIVNVLTSLDIYSLPTMGINKILGIPFIFVLVYFFSIIYLATIKGRIYCNTICPVGTLLGLVSKISLFKIHLNESKCTKCGLCEVGCRSECINTKHRVVDYDRCVLCFDCIEICNNDAIEYKSIFGSVLGEDNGQEAKRRLISKILAFTGSMLLFKYKSVLANNKDSGHKNPVLPPGAGSVEEFNNNCTGCNLCVVNCPTGTMEPAFFDYGITGLFQPVLNYKEGYCAFECNNCSEICPVNALKLLALKEKQRTQIGVAHFEKSKCVVYRKETACGACDEHCPTKAVHLVPYKDHLKIPEIDQKKCLGCGACEHSCPVEGKAIWVSGNKKHKAVQLPVDEKTIDSIEPNFDQFPF